MTGLEIGIGDLGLRVVKPVFDAAGNHIGSVEFGGSVDGDYIKDFVARASDAAKDHGLQLSIVSKNIEGKYLYWERTSRISFPTIRKRSSIGCRAAVP